MIYKGRVVSIEEDHAIIITDKMSYVRVVKKNTMYIGMNIIFIEDDIYKHNKTYLDVLKYVAAILVIICSLATLYSISPNKQNDIAVAVVSIDINPSIEFELNNQNEIIKLLPLNKEAMEINDQHLLGKDIKEGIYILILWAIKNDYLTIKNNSILLSSVSLDEKYNFTLDDLTNGIKDRLIIDEDLKFINVYSIKSQLDHIELARELELSLGKYEVYKNLEAHDDITLQDVQDMKVGQLCSKMRHSDSNENIEVDDATVSNEQEDIMIQNRERYGNKEQGNLQQSETNSNNNNDSNNNDSNNHNNGDIHQGENSLNNAGQYGNINGTDDERVEDCPSTQEEDQDNNQSNGEGTTARPEVGPGPDNGNGKKGGKN